MLQPCGRRLSALELAPAAGGGPGACAGPLLLSAWFGVIVLCLFPPCHPCAGRFHVVVPCCGPALPEPCPCVQTSLAQAGLPRTPSACRLVAMYKVGQSPALQRGAETATTRLASKPSRGARGSASEGTCPAPPEVAWVHGPLPHPLHASRAQDHFHHLSRALGPGGQAGDTLLLLPAAARQCSCATAVLTTQRDH